MRKPLTLGEVLSISLVSGNEFAVSSHECDIVQITEFPNYFQLEHSESITIVYKSKVTDVQYSKPERGEADGYGNI